MSAAPAASLRVAFVGQSVFFAQCALPAPAAGLAPTFIDFRQGARASTMLAQLAESDPDVVLVFRPEIIPAHAFDDLRAVTIGYLTEPLPRAADGGAHQDLRTRLAALREVDPGNFDRIVSFDPLIAHAAGEILPVWRSLPIPVADSMYREPRPRGVAPSLLFVGRSTAHRERMLAPLKARHPILHVGHGLFGTRLNRIMGASDVQINLHNNPYPTFENRVSLALAAGQLVISEPLSPDHDLRDGRDLLIVASAEELATRVDELMADSSAYRELQITGRATAERFRASTVYPALLRDALGDISARGTDRRRPSPPAQVSDAAVAAR